MNNKPKAVFVAIICIIIIICSSSIFVKAENNKDKKAIIILINRLSLEDIDKMNYLKSIVEQGSIGLMNTRANEYNNDYASTATIGAGSKTDARHDTTGFVNNNKENVEIFKRRTGFKYNGEEIVNLDISKLIELNKGNNYNPNIGALGESINVLNRKAAVIGNSDIDNYKVRLGPLIVMNELGLVENGNIEENVSTSKATSPFGLMTNYDFIIDTFKESYEKYDLIVVELGDLYRLEKYKDNLSEDMFVNHRHSILKNMDISIKRISDFIEANEAKLMIVNPYPSYVAYVKGERLTPFIAMGKNVNKGIFTSHTTRRKGIISNVDIAPYIIKYFNGSTDEFIGYSMKTISMEDKFSYIKELNSKTAYIYKNRINILYTFALYEIIISVIAFIGIQLFNKYKFNSNAIQFLLLSNMAIPFILLILPFFKTNSFIESIVMIILLTALVTFIAIYIRRTPLDSLIFLAGLTTIALILDILNNSMLMKSSFLGYDPIIGARFYGVGNEYMGILIGSSIVFLTCVIDRFQINKLIAIPIMLMTIISIGFPNLGANVGGAITSVFAFMFVMLRLLNDNLRFKHYCYMFLGIILVLMTLGLIDFFLIEGRSHFASSLNQIINSGSHTVISIIKRKVSMNFKLLGITIWSKVLLSSLLLVGILFYRPFGITKNVLVKYPNVAIGLLGVLTASLLGFLVNDSGVVVSATAIIFLIMSIMYLIFNELEEMK